MNPTNWILAAALAAAGTVGLATPTHHRAPAPPATQRMIDDCNWQGGELIATVDGTEWIYTCENADN